MAIVKTKVDELCFFLNEQKGKEATAGVIADYLTIPAKEVEALALILQQRGVCEVTHAMAVPGGPLIKLKRIWQPAEEKKQAGAVSEEYTVTAHNMPARVQILASKEDVPSYSIDVPLIEPYTKEFLSNIRGELARTVPISTEEITDPRRNEAVIKRFFEAASGKLRLIPKLSDEDRLALSGALLHAMYGLGDIELLLADDALEEIAINGSQNPISVYHKKYGWLKTNMSMDSEDEIYNYAAQIGRKSGRNVTVLSPIMDTHLMSGDRVSSTLFPISTCGHTITIRKFAREPWTTIDFMDPKIHTLSSDIAAFLWLCMQYEMNILVAGGTASGKTSMLNTFTALIPASHRTITIEDTRELQLPSYLKWNWVPLTTRNQNPEGKGGVTMLNLLTSSLRMRPDRIIVGEVRKRREAEVMFEAMHTGHAVYSTMHADTAQQVLRRLTHPPFDLPVTELQSLHAIVVMHRDRRTGQRRVSEVSEVLTSSADILSLNNIFRWRARQDKFEKVNDSLRIFEELNLHTGMNLDELAQDLKEKKSILEWMSKRGIRNVDQVGEVVGRFYRDPKSVVNAAAKDYTLKKLLE